MYGNDSKRIPDQKFLWSQERNRPKNVNILKNSEFQKVACYWWILRSDVKAISVKSIRNGPKKTIFELTVSNATHRCQEIWSNCIFWSDCQLKNRFLWTIMNRFNRFCLNSTTQYSAFFKIITFFEHFRFSWFHRNFWLGIHLEAFQRWGPTLFDT